MNIAQAKDQIESAMKAYFTKDEFGAYRIPIEKQRPVFMIGPPGIGKTAIMEVEEEFGVKVHPIVTVVDIHEYLKEHGTDPELLKAMEGYMEQYCVL